MCLSAEPTRSQPSINGNGSFASGGIDRTRARGLLRYRQRSNQLNYAPALKTNSLRLPRIPLAACPS